MTELYQAIRETVDYETALGSEFTYRELFSGGDLQNFRRMCLCFGIQFMEEMGGANMVTYYMSVLFLQMGLSHFMVRGLQMKVISRDLNCHYATFAKLN